MNLDWLSLEWIDANKEWLFSGVGLSVIGILFSTLGFAFILYRMHKQKQQVTINQHLGDNITINLYSKRLFIGIFVVSVIGLFVEIFHSPSPQTVITLKNGSTISGPVHTGQGDNVINNNYGIKPDRFQQLSEDLGVTKVALKTFFKITEKKQVPLEDLDNTLREIAKHYKELLTKVDTLNPDDPKVAKLVKQAKKALEDGEFDKAEELFNQASELDIKAAEQAQEVANKRFVSAAESLAANGSLKQTQLAYREAGEYYERAANLLPVGNDEVLAGYLNRAGYAFYHAALYDQAKPLYERSLAIWEKVHDKEHPLVATSLNNLASLYDSQGEYDQAKPLYERSLAIKEKVLGPEHPSVATSLNNLASLYDSQGNV
ncbi:TPR repeat protein [Beggiatoa sp. PS]|nr:TPR repeat protein [Beggiatoa sp. PS]